MGRLKTETTEMSPRRMARDVTVRDGVTLQADIDAREARLQAARIDALYQAALAMSGCIARCQEAL